MAKAISLWQPWASLCVLGLKQYETRHWSTAYRGTLVIHAAKRPLTTSDQFMLITWKQQAFVDEDLIWELGHLPLFGAALGTVELTAIYRTDQLEPKISDKELSFGNYEPGRYAWRLENPQPFPKPIPYRGHQGMWEWDLPLLVEG